MNNQLYGNNILKKKLNNFFRYFFYPRYTKCIVLTNEDKELWGFSNIEVIPNYSAIQFCKSSKPSLNSKTAITVGRLSIEKDYKTLIDSWKIVKEFAPDWTLLIYGGGDLKDELNEQIVNNELSDVVKLMGVSTSIQNEYLKASFFILSSMYEGMPLCLIEAMQAGLPCVSFDISGVPEIIDSGNNGYIARPRTTEMLAETIIKIIKSENEYDWMSTNARTTAKRFDKEVIMQKWINLFEKVTNENCN